MESTVFFAAERSRHSGGSWAYASPARRATSKSPTTVGKVADRSQSERGTGGSGCRTIGQSRGACILTPHSVWRTAAGVEFDSAFFYWEFFIGGETQNLAKRAAPSGFGCSSAAVNGRDDYGCVWRVLPTRRAPENSAVPKSTRKSSAMLTTVCTAICGRDNHDLTR